MMRKDGISLKLINIQNTVCQSFKGIRCFFVLSGSVNLTFEGKQSQLYTDDIFITNESQMCIISGNPSALVLVLWIPATCLENECSELNERQIVCNSSEAENVYDDKQIYELKRLLIMMKHVDSEKEYGYHLQFHILFLQFLQVLLLQFAEEKENKKEKRQRTDIIEEIINYLHMFYYQDISVREISSKFFMSSNYFSKYFKRHSGSSFLEYLTNIRLEHAVQELLFTKLTVTTIGLENGFPNFHSFSAAFKKKYNHTPAEYRRLYANDNIRDFSEILMETSDPKNAAEFLRYIRRYNVAFKRNNEYEAAQQLNISAESISKFCAPFYLININHYEVALRTQFVNCIKDMTQFHIKYAYFGFPLQEFSLTYNQNPFFNEFAQTVEVLQDNNLVPFFRIALSEENLEVKELKKSTMDCFAALLNLLKNWFPQSYVNQWKFEFCLEEDRVKDAEKVYEKMAGQLKSVLPSVECGLCITNISEYTFKSLLEKFYPEILEFVTFNIFPNNYKKEFLPDVRYYPFEGLHKKTVANIHQICERITGHALPVYMTEWNTLMGSSDAEVDVYFRSALIMQALWETRTLIKSSAFWFDTPTCYKATKERQTISLALYLYGYTRRPVYYVLELFQRLGEDIIYEDEKKHFVLTRNSDCEWTLIMWNPCFLNPCYCLNDPHLKQEAKKIQLELTGIPDGRYRIKKILLERNSSGLQAEYDWKKIYIW